MSLFVDIEKKLKNLTLKISFDTGQSSGISGILGASGCGKSMSLKCIAGIETPDQGRIILNGRILFDSDKKINLKVQERKVGYLFQNYALFPNMTVSQNLEIAAGHTKDKKKIVNQYLELLQIRELADRYPRCLSGGQQQRTALARILVSNPDVLMFDEPFSALDNFLKENLQIELLEQLKKYSSDILMVTHSRDEIYRFCENMYVLNQGKLVASGKTKEVFQSPGSAEAAKLTGCKNITAVKKKSKNCLWIPEWNLDLTFTKDIPDHITHIGIRSHDLREKVQGDQKNTVCCETHRVIEDPFEVTVIINGTIWWKVSKEVWFHHYQQKVPDAIVLPEDKLLLLKA